MKTMIKFLMTTLVFTTMLLWSVSGQSAFPTDSPIPSAGDWFDEWIEAHTGIAMTVTPTSASINIGASTTITVVFSGNIAPCDIADGPFGFSPVGPTMPFELKDCTNVLSDNGAELTGLQVRQLSVTGLGVLTKEYTATYRVIGSAVGIYALKFTVTTRSREKTRSKTVNITVNDVDADGDTYGATTDCDDTNPAIKPGVVEDCVDDIDNNCDSLIDTADTITCPDADADGSADVEDCDNADASVYPDAPETCDDTVDKNCDTIIMKDTDPSCATPAEDNDADNDGFNSNMVTGGTDCDDSEFAINPDAAEVCDGMDNDCDGQIDEEVSTTYYMDTDGDGYGGIIEKQACALVAGYSTINTDCDDNMITTNPGAPEICSDNLDNNCDDTVDETSTCVVDLSVVDVDGDGVPASTDCNDNDASVYPGATDDCNNLIDKNCDGSTSACTSESDPNGAGNVAGSSVSGCSLHF